MRLLLCENHPDAPADLLLRTYLEAQVITRSDLPAKPNFPRSGRARDATSPDPQRQHLSLLGPATTPEQVERLSHDEEQYVRAAAAGDRRLSPARRPEDAALHKSDRPHRNGGPRCLAGTRDAALTLLPDLHLCVVRAD